ncbi:hypothetical protein HBH68_219770 [Parastagonospora nodorum]|nr:hypothetical protein HBH68_219770 [Parastagonospora nodorum]
MLLRNHPNLNHWCNLRGKIAPITHEIDPEADTIITLKNASAIFATWDFDFENTSSAAGALSSEVYNENDISESSDRSGEKKEKDIYFRVSSRHLALASPWFNRALAKEKWSESNRDKGDGLFHLTTSDWDAEAFLILLSIFHVRHRDVPKELSLELLAKIAVLVDYYECGETVELFSEMWISSAKAKITHSLVYDQNLVLWMWVSWVFGVDDIFTKTTVTAIRQSKESLNTLGLPIPAMVYAEIDTKRNLAIEDVVDKLHKLLDSFRDSSYLCPVAEDLSFQCGAYQLGLLTKTLDSMALLSPRPEPPFANLSLENLNLTLSNFKSPKWSPYMARVKHQSYHTCDVGQTIREMVGCVDQTVTGLDLSKIRDRTTE